MKAKVLAGKTYKTTAEVASTIVLIGIFTTNVYDAHSFISVICQKSKLMVQKKLTFIMKQMRRRSAINEKPDLRALRECMQVRLLSEQYAPFKFQSLQEEN